jgi:hypothetical protein
MLAQPGVEVIFVDLPQTDPPAIDLWLALQNLGFFFCGIEPRDILTYIGKERERVARRGA